MEWMTPLLCTSFHGHPAWAMPSTRKSHTEFKRMAIGKPSSVEDGADIDMAVASPISVAYCVVVLPSSRSQTVHCCPALLFPKELPRTCVALWALCCPCPGVGLTALSRPCSMLVCPACPSHIPCLALATKHPPPCRGMFSCGCKCSNDAGFRVGYRLLDFLVTYIPSCLHT